MSLFTLLKKVYLLFDIKYTYKRIQQQKLLKKYARIDKESFLTEMFELVLPLPVARTYLSVGKKSHLSCTIIVEADKGEVIIGDNVYIGPSKLISRSSITIEDYVTIAWGCTIYDHDSHSLDYRERIKDSERQMEDELVGRCFIASKDWSVVKTKPIIIRKHAWIGMNSIILKGVEIGEGAVVAAGSVVTKSVPPFCVAAGNPARVVKQIDRNS